MDNNNEERSPEYELLVSEYKKAVKNERKMSDERYTAYRKMVATSEVLKREEETERKAIETLRKTPKDSPEYPVAKKKRDDAIKERSSAQWVYKGTEEDHTHYATLHNGAIDMVNSFRVKLGIHTLGC